MFALIIAVDMYFEWKLINHTREISDMAVMDRKTSRCAMGRCC